MPWRGKPERWLQYWSGSTPTKAKADGFQSVLVYCLGPPAGFGHVRCYHNARLSLDDLPEWGWRDISAHLRCTHCDTVGYVDTRPDWSEIIDFNKGIS